MSPLVWDRRLGLWSDFWVALWKALHCRCSWLCRGFMELSRINQQWPWPLFKWVSIISVFFFPCFLCWSIGVWELGWTTWVAVDPSCDTWSRTHSTPFLLGKSDAQMGNEEANSFIDWGTMMVVSITYLCCPEAVKEWASFQRETEARRSEVMGSGSHKWSGQGWGVSPCS